MGLNTAQLIARKITDSGYPTYLVGGCVRDLLLYKPSTDFDLVTTATPDHILSMYSHTVYIGESFGVVRIIGDAGEHYDVATARSDGEYTDRRHPDTVEHASVEADVHRRDFTINGLLMDADGNIVDHIGGRADLQARLVRAIGHPYTRFKEDPLRMLRAVRFASTLNMKIGLETQIAIRQLAKDINIISQERVRDELLKILVGPRPGEGIRWLHDLSLLPMILPEIEAMIGVEQPPQFHREGDVFTHTCLVLDAAGPRALSEEVMLACLLHDVGKPCTYTMTDRIRFHGHDLAGAHMTKVILQRLKCSNDQIDQVCWLIENHMRFGQLQNMRMGRRARFMAHPWFPGLLEVGRADRAGCSEGNLDYYDWSVNEWARFNSLPADKIPANSKLISGKDIIARGVKEGQMVGKILRAVDEEVLEDRITTRDEALAFADKLIAAFAMVVIK